MPANDLPRAVGLEADAPQRSGHALGKPRLGRRRVAEEPGGTRHAVVWRAGREHGVGVAARGGAPLDPVQQHARRRARHPRLLQLLERHAAVEARHHRHVAGHHERHGLPVQARGKRQPRRPRQQPARPGALLAQHAGDHRGHRAPRLDGLSVEALRPADKVGRHVQGGGGNARLRRGCKRSVFRLPARPHVGGGLCAAGLHLFKRGRRPGHRPRRARQRLGDGRRETRRRRKRKRRPGQRLHCDLSVELLRGADGAGGSERAVRRAQALARLHLRVVGRGAGLGGGGGGGRRAPLGARPLAAAALSALGAGRGRLVCRLGGGRVHRLNERVRALAKQLEDVVAAALPVFGGLVLLLGIALGRSLASRLVASGEEVGAAGTQAVQEAKQVARLVAHHGDGVLAAAFSSSGSGRSGGPGRLVHHVAPAERVEQGVHHALLLAVPCALSAARRRRGLVLGLRRHNFGQHVLEALRRGAGSRIGVGHGPCQRARRSG
mmetsp:Transcript_5007/g.21482  ORF Transcript_5007/g.21482 Transcript_5007/m.21482 type:complete len:494 (-) Transcript_5007:1017-2498(-)